MGNLLDSLKSYFENTPQDVLEKDWREIEYLNEIGPDVFEYVDFVKSHFDIEFSYSSSDKKLETHTFSVSAKSTDCDIPADAKYCLAS